MLRFKLVAPLYYFIMLFVFAGIFALFIGCIVSGLLVQMIGINQQIVWCLIGFIWTTTFLFLSCIPPDTEL